ncbi:MULTISPECIES: hypothetical protein [Raoultella]|uniref:hypothetical protein n=1 Tax=Raoultella TaxID=160674 RepID=UPI002A59CC4F|nr:hypothetical protein [Raoultella ornithinolytica]WKL82055.1 hypothetical protein Q1L34_16235 [Raoultella ornithinolytica]WPO20728.1 hypothetical protein SH579_07335 [Raoultella ornithinolytica]
MGSMKKWAMIRVESEREEWIRARLSSPDLEEDSEEWQLLEKEYDDYQQLIEDEAYNEYEEQKWLEENPHTTIFDTSISLLKEIEEEGKIHKNETFIKMQISYSITIMESCLSEMIKSVVASHEIYMSNAIKNIDELKGKNIPLSDLLNKQNTPEKYVQEYLSGLLYHKISKIFEVYKAILQPGKRIHVDMSDVIKLTRRRHDIVHRNGKTVNGDAILFEYKDLESTFSIVKRFLISMKEIISDAIEYHENEQKKIIDDF